MPPADRSSHASSIASPSSDDVPASPSAADVGLDVDDTMMETYRLALPHAAGGVDPDATVRAFLDALDACARGLCGLLRGSRHVELFAPCAS